MTRLGGLRNLMAQAVEVVQVRYFREGMLALPYGGRHKFDGAGRVESFRHDTFKWFA